MPAELAGGLGVMLGHQSYDKGVVRRGPDRDAFVMAEAKLDEVTGLHAQLAEQLGSGEDAAVGERLGKADVDPGRPGGALTRHLPFDEHTGELLYR